jgi:hypothetical protein
LSKIAENCDHNIDSRYEGYNIDLIDEISKILGFNYSIHIVADGAYGSYNPKTNTWDRFY